jgi:hypothetical protein
MNINERGFEDTIESSLLSDGGYMKSQPSNFDPILGLDTAELFAFVGATQPKSGSSSSGGTATTPTTLSTVSRNA